MQIPFFTHPIIITSITRHMKKSFRLLAVSFCLPFALMAGDNEQKIEAPITSVTVYLNGAQVEHSKNVTLLPGRNELHFIGLSSKLIPKSIQFTATGDVSVLAISNRVDYLFGQKKNDARAKQLNDSLTMMSDALAITQGQISAYEGERQLLDANRSIGGNDKGVAPADLKANADFYYQRMSEINTELVKLRRKEADQQELVTRLSLAANDANARTSPPMGEITVLLSVTGAIKVESTVALGYVVSDCGWAPSYDLIAEDVGKPIDLKYRAKVFNNTNVDWKNVTLKLSTSNPMQSATAPQLTMWPLNFDNSYSNYNQNYYYNNQPAQDYGAAPQSLSQQNLANSTAPAAYGGAADGDLKKPYSYKQQEIQRVQQYNQIQVSELSAEFDIKQKYDVPADAKPYIVDVTQYTLNAMFQYHCVPKMEREAFLMARITGWEELDLVEGPANVYFGGTYVGQSYIDTRSVDDTLDLSLGRDQKLVVTRTKLKEFNSEKASTTTKKETYSFEIAVKNTRKTMVQVELQDQIPVSQEAEIIVETPELSKGTLDPATGIVTWNMSIPPGETQKVVLTYTIKYPKNKSVKTKKYRTTSAPAF